MKILFLTRDHAAVREVAVRAREYEILVPDRVPVSTTVWPSRESGELPYQVRLFRLEYWHFRLGEYDPALEPLGYLMVDFNHQPFWRVPVYVETEGPRWSPVHGYREASDAAWQHLVSLADLG